MEANDGMLPECSTRPRHYVIDASGVPATNSSYGDRTLN